MKAQYGLVVLVATGLAGLGGPSLANAAPEAIASKAISQKQCVDGHNLSRRMVVDKTTLLIEDGFGRAALLTLSKPCQNLDDFDRIGFEFSGPTQICDRRDVKILYSRFNEAPLRCLIETVTPLTREQAAKY